MQTEKPILLLDVDGVLNVIDKTCAKRRVPLEYGPGQIMSFYPIKTTRRLMKLAWRRFDVRWLTAWRKGANLIARWAGLEERPVLIAYSSDDWKAEAVRQTLMSWEGRLAWIEDGISPEAKAIVASKGWTYFHCDPFVGATEEDLKRLAEFADAGEIEIPPCKEGKKHWFGRWYHASSLSPMGPRRYRKCRRCMHVDWEANGRKEI